MEADSDMVKRCHVVSVSDLDFSSAGMLYLTLIVDANFLYIILPL